MSLRTAVLNLKYTKLAIRSHFLKISGVASLWKHLYCSKSSRTPLQFYYILDIICIFFQIPLLFFNYIFDRCKKNRNVKPTTIGQPEEQTTLLGDSVREDIRGDYMASYPPLTATQVWGQRAISNLGRPKHFRVMVAKGQQTQEWYIS